jgi:hypothetical protein
LFLALQSLQKRQPAVPYHRHKLTMLFRDLCVPLPPVFRLLSVLMLVLFVVLACCCLPRCSLNGTSDGLFLAHVAPTQAAAQATLATAAFAAYLGDIRRKACR